MGQSLDVTYSSTEIAPLRSVLERLFTPLARLCLANGIRFDVAEEQLKRSFITEAQALHPDQPEHGLTSRVSAATGINRRETTRLLREAPTRRNVKIPLAAQVVARWATAGIPLCLPRLGDAPSFESLARDITRDLHPRTVLDELSRLAIVRHDEEADQVYLLQKDYIPGGDQVEMFGFLRDNVGDHLESAVANVLKDDIQHHDQAIFADELSEASLKELAPLILQQWQELKDRLIPAISGLLDTDLKAEKPGNRRVRVGMYSYSEPWAEG